MATDPLPAPRSDPASDPAPLGNDSACVRQTVVASDGARLTACRHGGHVTGWTPAGGTERLWLSPATGCGHGVAIRGGIPVIFPQFAGRGPLPKHGFARNRAWQRISSPLAAETGADAPSVALWQARLTQDEETLAIWPFRFELVLTARAWGEVLQTTLTARNTGDVGWSFTAALHSYLALGRSDASVLGLSGRTAQDNAAAGRLITLGSAGLPLTATTERDVAVLGVDQPVLLDDPVLGELSITAEGFGDRVLWNPGAGHRLADLAEGAEQDFVCIEPAALTAVTLPPGAAWNGTLTLRAKA